MKLIVILSLTLAFSEAVLAQDLSDNIKQVRLHTLKGDRVRIENLSASAIVAMHARYECSPALNHGSRASMTFDFDPLSSYDSQYPVLSKGFYSFAIDPEEFDCPGGVDAIVFANGTAIGSQKEISTIYARRQALAAGTEKVVSLLKSVVAGSMATVDAIEQLNTDQELVLHTPGKTPEDRYEVLPYVIAADALSSGHELSTPRSHLIHNQTPSEAAQVRDYSRERLLAYRLQKQFSEWSSDLRANLEEGEPYQGVLSPQGGISK